MVYMYQISKQLLILAIISLLAFFNIFLFHNAIFGWLILFFYLFNTSQGSFSLLTKFFNFPEKLWRIRILGMFLSLAGLGLWSAPFVAFGHLSSPLIALVFFINGFFWLLMDYWSGHALRAPVEELPEKDFYLEQGSGGPIGALLYLILIGFSFYLLGKNVSDGNIQTPWFIIDYLYLYIFGLSTLLLGLLIFTRLQGKTILCLLIAHSLLLHSYLPLSHQLLYGADAWRHLSAETQILQEEKITAVVYDTGSILHALNPGQFSYASFRGLTVILSRLLNVGLIPLNAWFLPVVWSIFFPILLFEFAFNLGWKKREALFFVFLSFLPFVWQAAGSFSLPVNFGFLLWFFGLLLILKRLKEERTGQVSVLILYGLFLSGGYILFFILFWLAWGVAELSISKVNEKIRGFLLALSLLLFPFVIPVIELLTKYSVFDLNKDWLGQARQLVGNFSAFYLASGPRTHDILTGNIIFNQTPSYAFATNFLTEWRWWLFGVSSLIVISAFVGLVLMVFKVAEEKYHWLSILFVGVFGSYAISRYVLGGENILARRLDMVLILFILLSAFYTWRILFEKLEKSRLVVLLMTIIVVSATITASYSLGPDTYSASVDEYEAVKYIWKTDSREQFPCVIGDTYPLLVLEAVSGGRVVGGGFPMNEYFAQPERVKLFQTLSQGANRPDWLLAMRFTMSDHCWFVVNKNNFTPNNFFDAEGRDVRGYGDILVWRYAR